MRIKSLAVYLAVLLVALLSGVALRPAGGGSTPRFERLGPYGGDARSLLIDAGDDRTVYLGTSNGKIYKSSDAGRSWRVLSPGIGQPSYVIDDLMQHPDDPKHLYVGAWDLNSDGGGLFESRDSGESWTRMRLPRESTAIRDVAFCRTRPDNMLVGTGDGVFLTADGGVEWREVGKGLLSMVESVAIDPRDPATLYVGTWRLGYVSRDHGATWTRIERGMPLDSDVFSMTINPANPAVVYASACSGVYRSDDGLRSWTRLRVKPGQFTVRAYVVYLDPSDAGKVYTGTAEGLFMSRNSGQSWTRLTSGDLTVNAIQVSPSDSRRILIGTEYQGVLVSEDGGASWRPSNDGFINKQIAWVQFDPTARDTLLAGMHSGGGGWYSRRGGDARWGLEQIEPGMRALSFLALPGGAGRLVGTPQGVYHQKGASAPWRKLTGGINLRTVYSLAVDPGLQIVYAGTDQGIYRAPVDTLDFKMPRGNRLVPKAWQIIAPAETPGIVFAGTNMGLLRSQDRGVTWKVTSAYGLPERVTIYSLAVVPGDKDRFFAGTSAGLFESSSGGVYWERSGGGNLGFSISAVLFPGAKAWGGRRILAADRAAGGLFRSEDGGASWDKISSPGFASPVYCMAEDPDDPSKVYVGTRDEGIYLLRFGD
ncbi:MAG: hypothetical protein LBT74_02050 [Acidobacteriota bacterium]|jgi:photosystem II stability/assembly factor-like uncharacterized protein|nr:hypothetical protein [Acidobacteriota bacterium]